MAYSQNSLGFDEALISQLGTVLEEQRFARAGRALVLALRPQTGDTAAERPCLTVEAAHRW